MGTVRPSCPHCGHSIVLIHVRGPHWNWVHYNRKTEEKYCECKCNKVIKDMAGKIR